MRQFIVSLALAAVLAAGCGQEQSSASVGVLTEAEMSVLYTDNNFLIHSGTDVTPSVAVPADTTFCILTMGRENWPLAGVTIRIQFTYDNVNFSQVAEAFVEQGVINPKTGTVDPAGIGFGWNNNPQPLRARMQTVSPSNFRTPITIEVL
jgi:hypothetical protein